MTKILTGCLIVAVVAGVAFGVAGYYAFRFAKPMVESASDYVARARDLASIGDDLTNKATFVPPDGAELSPGQVDRFLAVQTRVRSEMEDRWNEVESQAAEIRRTTEISRSDLSVAELQGIFSGLANIYLEARKAQVKALNVQKFSDSEYSWVRRRIYEAAGLELAHSIDLSALEDLARNGAQKAGVTLPDVALPAIPKANAALVKPHAAKLKAWLPMAILGL